MGRYRLFRISRMVVAAALLIAIVLATGIILGWWSWKTLIGWRALVDYINPRGASQKKEALQVYVVIVAGVIASITAAVGLANLRLTRRNLEQQRELEAQRAQGTALQAYYEQIGKLITDKDLLNTEHKEIRELARGQTLTVLQEVDGKGKGSLLTFLHGAGLIGAENPAVRLTGADLRYVDVYGAMPEGSVGSEMVFAAHMPNVDLRGADLSRANLQNVNFEKATLQKANLYGANLQEANLQKAHLSGADLSDANLSEADLSRATGITNVEVEQEAHSLERATMPNGQMYEDWLKDRESREGDGEDI